MTCIVGLRDNGIVYIGADSAGIDVSSLEIRPRLDKKVFKSDDFVIGFSGSFRGGQILKYNVLYPEIKKHAFSVEEVEKYFVSEFVESVRDAFIAHGFPTDDDSCPFIVGYNGWLVHIESDYQVGIYEDFTATGSGSAYALGSLHSTVGMDPEYRITLALGAAAEYNAGVRGPFYIERT
jgi:20S proteasome alpha/beta subunit